MHDLGAAGRMRIFSRPLVWWLIAVSVVIIVVGPLATIVAVILTSTIVVLSVTSIILEPSAMMSTSVVMVIRLKRENDRRGLGLLLAEICKDLVFIGEPLGKLPLEGLHKGDLGWLQFLAAAVFIAGEIQVYLTVWVGHSFGSVAQYFIDN